MGNIFHSGLLHFVERNCPAMTTGSKNKIDLGTSIFEDIISKGCFYVDKTRFIEHFLTSSSTVSLVARQRRLGKSLNMDMLRSFLTEREDLRHLFKGLYIESSPVWEMVNTSPVFSFDFKGLTAAKYKVHIYDMVVEHIDAYCNEDELPRAIKRYVRNEEFDSTEGLRYLTEAVYKATGKRSYILIDEYDKLLMDNFRSDSYDEMRNFFTALFSAVLKGNRYLEKAMLTGVLRISHESMFSGLNNIVTFDVFTDDVYKDDYGFTEEDIAAINQLEKLDKEKLRKWYNGVRISGKPIYNTYSVMSYLFQKDFGCFWGKSGTMQTIADLVNDERQAVLARLLNGEEAEVPVANRISLQNLSKDSNDEAFYSLLVQGGYLALNKPVYGKTQTYNVTIPNIELMMVWKEFILENVFSNIPQVRTIFDNIDSPEDFKNDLEYFLSDRLSYYDLAAPKGMERRKNREQLYHAFVLGILSAYEDIHCRPLSNRESGDGRYDILAVRPCFYIIFEFKVCDKEDNLEASAVKALAQIETKRYGDDLDKSKKLIRVGIAFCGKICRVMVG